MKFVDVVVDSKTRGLDRFFLYKTELLLDVGDEVIVPFGKDDKEKKGYVFNVYDSFENALSKDENIADIEIKDVVKINKKNALTYHNVRLCEYIKKSCVCRHVDCIPLFLEPKGSKKKLDDLEYDNLKEFDQVILNREQNRIFEIVASNLRENEDKKVFLLNGITASGKSEIYLKLLEEIISLGKTGVLIVPELLLTGELIDKIFFKFKNIRDEIVVYHSGLKPKERFLQWQKIKKNKVKVLIGTRISLFTPLENIGIIIMDEEHSQAYKSNKTPKYDSRDIAQKLANINRSTLVMGSATPSMESLKKVEDGDYIILDLKERYNYENNIKIDVVNMADELKAGNKTIFSRILYDNIEKNLKENNQTLLVVGNHGTSFYSCRSCDFVSKCSKCNVAMTYYKKEDILKCRICSKTQRPLRKCPKCDSPYMKGFGIGSEKVKEELLKFFPKAKIEIFNVDEHSNLEESQNILKQFEEGEIDILIGNQVITKGFNFKNLVTVGIIALDGTINSFDFRGGEKTYQLIVHSSGRAGRFDKKGNVIIQTYKPEYYPIGYALENNIDEFYRKEKEYRKTMGYFPFGHLAEIVVIGKKENLVKKEFFYVLKNIEESFGKSIILDKKMENTQDEQENFRYNILCKLKENQKEQFIDFMESIKEDEDERKYGVNILVDIDPKKIWRN